MTGGDAASFFQRKNFSDVLRPKPYLRFSLSVVYYNCSKREHERRQKNDNDNDRKVSNKSY